MSLNLSHTSTSVLKPQILDEIDARVAGQHLLQHPFYQTWSRGELSLEALRDYAAQYYHHVAAFPTYLSAVHAQTENAEVRRHILSNLIDEEAGAPNHPELWLQFAESLGLDRTEVRQSAQWPATKKLIGDFRSCCSNRGTGVGLAALYAYESQIPSVSEKKIKVSGSTMVSRIRTVTNTSLSTSRLTVSMLRSKRHRLRSWWTHERRAALEAVGEILAGLYGLLSAVCERHGIDDCLCKLGRTIAANEKARLLTGLFLCCVSGSEAVAALSIGDGVQDVVSCLQLAAVAVSEGVVVDIGLFAALPAVGSEREAGG